MGYDDTLENFMKRDKRKLKSVDQDSTMKSNLKGNEKFGILFLIHPKFKDFITKSYFPLILELRLGILPCLVVHLRHCHPCRESIPISLNIKSIVRFKNTHTHTFHSVPTSSTKLNGMAISSPLLLLHLAINFPFIKR